jgi:hypothetical protein
MTFSNGDAKDCRPVGIIVDGGAFEARYFFNVFFDIPSSRATRLIGSRSLTQRIRMSSQISNVINPFGGRSKWWFSQLNQFGRPPTIQ